MADENSSNILIRGADGRLYAISAEQLEQYAIPDEQAQEMEERLHLSQQSVSVFEPGDEDSGKEVGLNAGFTTAGFTSAGFTKGGFTSAGFTKGKLLTFVNMGFFGFSSRKK